MSTRRRSDPGRKPLSLPVVHILLALWDADLHGYAIKQAVEERTGGQIRLGPGTLYEAIERLEDAGLIEETEAPATPAHGQEAQRRYYHLTARGWQTLRDELRPWARLVDEARANPRLRKELA